MDFSKFFSNFDSMESLAILFIMIIAFLFGLIVGLLIRGGTIRRLKNELEQKNQDLANAQAEIARLQEEQNLQEADLRKAQFEAEENRSKVARLADEKTKLYNEVYALNNQVEQLKLNAGTSSADDTQLVELNETIERLTGELASLQSRNVQLENELKGLQEASITSYSEPVDYLAEFQSTQNAMRARLESLEQKLGKVEAENSILKSTVQELKDSDNNANPIVFEQTGVENRNLAEVEDVIFSARANKAILMDPILHETPDRDDLTQIKGISPFLQKQLNDAGVYTYEQISHWDPSDMHRIVQEIGYLPGRIEQDDWIGQAIQLQQQKENQPEAFETRGQVYPTQPDDLKIIEGIGPKIEGLLKDAGIHTWEELADTEPDQLREILNAAGESYRIHDPSTWPAQARLAVNESWELLREYQDQLKGGREVD